MSTQRLAYDLVEQTSSVALEESRSRSKVDRGSWMAGSMTFWLCVLHGWAIWIGVGGRAGIVGQWPILIADHGFHYYHGVVTRDFLRTTWMTAGYDPNFMSGYPMSVITGTSSTLTNLAILAVGKDRPEVTFKALTFLCVAGLPALMAMAAFLFRASPASIVLSVFLYLVYFWTAFPISYASFGMTSYLISVPIELITTALLSNYLSRGGFGRWLAAAVASSTVFLVHLTSVMVVGPAVLLAYIVAVTKAVQAGSKFSIWRHFGLVAFVPVILLGNAFWLAPGYWLASTSGKSDFAFAHPESVVRRVADIVWTEAPVESIAMGLALIGLAAMSRRDLVAASGLGGVIMAGFGWGYLAGAFRSLDFLQPGRHTYTCFSAACLAGGIGLGEILIRLRSSRAGRLDRVAMIAMAIIATRVFGPALASSIKSNVGGTETFLSSRPSARLLQVVSMVKKYVKPGERLLFEESGFAVDGLIDPYEGRHLSPILPQATGVEVIGGPYLHTPVVTNFTQFGENKLFERKEWDRDFFVRHARLYRPAAICCWSPKARSFCLANPDLIRVSEDDGIILFGRVIGFEGATIRGAAMVETGPNRLVVTNAVASPDNDGLVVLRYHLTPHLVTDPPDLIEAVKLEDDPVPFIGLRPTKGPITIRLALPPWRRSP